MDANCPACMALYDVLQEAREGGVLVGVEEVNVSRDIEAVKKDFCRCVSCHDCNGSGNVWVDMRGHYIGSRRSDDLDEMETCPTCNGGGLSEVCERCQLLEQDDRP